MERVLKERWIGDAADSIPVIDEASVALARERVRELGFSAAIGGAMVNVASELAHNQLAHARRGEIVVRRVARAGVPGIEIIAADEGAGMMDPASAILGAPRAQGSLGVGVAAVVELADEVDFDVRLGEGTCVRARKFAGEVPRAPVVGIYGRPFPEENVSGDDAIALRDGDRGLLVAIADGLGHGAPAREASELALVSAARATTDLASVFEPCHAALQGTRGAVMAIARIHERADVACVGNIGVQLYGARPTMHLTGPSFVLGVPSAGKRKPLQLAEPFAPRDVLVLYTDGVSTHLDLEGDHELLLRSHPIVIAQRAVERHGRSNDDALVVVVR